MRRSGEHGVLTGRVKRTVRLGEEAGTEAADPPYHERRGDHEALTHPRTPTCLRPDCPATEVE